ncbi:MAG: HAMP domain-containing histidine kinase, partial [Saprospiraceae bacterium]|nr:HAMP domain-containing histidine kinase [Saprospiraceae bacterium]
ENLTEEQFRLVTSAQRSLKKLSQLGQSLSLLTKIENREFTRGEKIDMSELVNEALQNFKELFEIKGLSVTANIKEKILRDLNPHLGTILINNLMHNALRHNIEGGRIEVILDDKHLEINNTGAVPRTPTERMFDRFEKNDPQSDSSGLGLAIVKEICDFHSMKIDYTYDHEHQINIYF